MNICMCGTQAGYPHDQNCPWPYFGSNEQEQERWFLDYRLNKGETVKPQASQPQSINHDAPLDTARGEIIPWD